MKQAKVINFAAYRSNPEPTAEHQSIITHKQLDELSQAILELIERLREHKPLNNA